MKKMQEANSDNQREKYQDDLKKEIKKLQRLRDQVKGWQNCSEIKDKDKLTHYRKIIEQRMEQFKDIERENKTKPHSKQGLSAEEKLDPREKEKVETIEWLQSQIRELSDEADRTESQIESISSLDAGKRRGKKEDGKKGEKEVCMRMVNNESLESKRVMEVLKDPLEMYVDALVDPDYEGDTEHLENLDPEGAFLGTCKAFYEKVQLLVDAYEELDLGALSAQIGGIQIGSLDEEKENGKHNGSVEAGQLGSLSGVNQATPPPPPPGIPYNSVAAGRIAASSSVTNTSGSATSPATNVVNAKTTVIAT
ncbi:Not1 domain, CCR4-Not complex component [Ancylostoma ceylanicum]|uniref:Not1 domain, CCR4-Not complex component n=1 Tax=Ancylostoma ceylanicum TaxID=53326 RepID=A0A0D6MAJ2_9BILA|nr:Not1 domain, CCR4-Not complex component [Ancylostoma ceylanicum]